MRLAVLVACGALGSLFVSGCGGSSDADAVESTLRGYLVDLIHGDGVAACSRLTGESKRRIAEKSDMASCEVAVAATVEEEQFGGDERAKALAEIKGMELRVEVDGDQATVTNPDGGNVKLVKVEGEWYLEVFALVG